MAATEAAPRVALLARAGDACDRIAVALREAGADVVLVADPLQAEPVQVRQAQPQAVLVALEPAIEDAIDRLEDVLADPQYMVIFEEADQAAQRAGWDAARWLRHLAAKLHRHDDVLPAGAGSGEDLQLTDATLPPPPAAVDFDQAIVAVTGQARQRADDVPADGLDGVLATAAEPVEQRADAAASRWQGDAADAGFASIRTDQHADERTESWIAADFGGLSLESHDAVKPGDAAPAGTELSTIDFGALSLEPVAASPAMTEPSTIDIDALALELDDAPAAGDESSSIDSSTLSLESEDASAARTDLPTIAFGTLSLDSDDALPLQVEASSVDFSALSLDPAEPALELEELSFDPERFNRAGQAQDAPAGIEEFLAQAARAQADAGQATADDVPAAAVVEGAAALVETPPPALASLDFSGLSLVADDELPVAMAAPAKAAPSLDLDSLGAGLSLVDPDSYGHAAPPGLVLIEAGLGGPDAVRQLLAALPEGFPQAILIRLALEGGRYDRLVKQMTRATTAPVDVAEAGAKDVAGHVHFVPPGLGLRAAGGGWAFEPGRTLAASSLPASDSAVLFLSGADVGQVAQAAAGWDGLVLAQTPDEGCYEPAAATAAIAAGADHGHPAELARRLRERWPAQGTRGPHLESDGMQ